MTGAQEQALERLHRRKEQFAIRSQPRQGDVKVEWQRRNPWGGFTRIKAVVTPEGRVVER